MLGVVFITPQLALVNCPAESTLITPKPIIPIPGSMPSILMTDINAQFLLNRNLFNRFYNGLFFVGGLLFGCCAPGIGLWLLAWVGLIPALIGLRLLPLMSKVAIAGFYFGCGYHLVWFCWFLGLYPMDWLGFTLWQSALIAIGAWLLLTIVGGVLFSVLFVLYRLLVTKTHWLITLLIFPLLWVALSQLWGQFDLFIPWAWIEYSQYQWCTQGLQAFTSPCAIVFYNALWAQVLWHLLNRKPALQIFSIQLNRLSRLLISMVCLISLPLCLVFATILYRGPEQAEKQNALPFQVHVLQGNLSIDEIRDETLLQQAKVQAYLTPLQVVTFDSVQKVPRLIVLPEEGVVSGWVNQHNPSENNDFTYLQQISDQKQAYIVVGLSSFVSNQKQTQLYNSMALLQPNNSPQFYDKHDLVVFGEREPNFLGLLPEGWLNSLFSNIGVDYQFGFSAGKRKALLQIEDFAILPTVCFELVSLPWDITTPPDNKPTVVINSSNLGWFHDHPMLEAQYKAIAQYKASYYHVPVVISANTGPSGVIIPQ